MKEFDIEKAKAGAPVCTRDGRPARIICWDRKDAQYPIMVLAERNGVEVVSSTTDRGRVFADGRISNGDLMMPTLKHEGWVNIYRTGDASADPHVYGPVWPDEAAAKDKAKESTTFIDTIPANYVATVKIEWEE